MTRAGNQWTLSYSDDGTNWQVAGSFSHALAVAQSLGRHGIEVIVCVEAPMMMAQFSKYTTGHFVLFGALALLVNLCGSVYLRSVGAAMIGFCRPSNWVIHAGFNPWIHSGTGLFAVALSTSNWGD